MVASTMLLLLCITIDVRSSGQAVNSHAFRLQIGPSLLIAYVRCVLYRYDVDVSVEAVTFGRAGLFIAQVSTKSSNGLSCC